MLVKQTHSYFKYALGPSPKLCLNESCPFYYKKGPLLIYNKCHREIFIFKSKQDKNALSFSLLLQFLKWNRFNFLWHENMNYFYLQTMFLNAKMKIRSNYNNLYQFPRKTLNTVHRTIKQKLMSISGIHDTGALKESQCPVA